MSTERPILFSAPMVLALLAGKKRQTRRIVSPGSTKLDDDGHCFFCGLLPEIDEQHICPPGFWASRSPYGKPGDRLWVKETFAPCAAPALKGHVHYRADGAVGLRQQTNGGDSWWARSGHTLGLADKTLHGVWVGPPKKWKPSIFMPRGASRITLEVTDVRVERLQAITATDAIAEGIERGPEPAPHMKVTAGWRDYARARDLGGVSGPVESYRSLWESINGGNSWTANPWVWVIKFNRCEVDP